MLHARPLSLALIVALVLGCLALNTAQAAECPGDKQKKKDEVHAKKDKSHKKKEESRKTTLEGVVLKEYVEKKDKDGEVRMIDVFYLKTSNAKVRLDGACDEELDSDGLSSHIDRRVALEAKVTWQKSKDGRKHMVVHKIYNIRRISE